MCNFVTELKIKVMKKLIEKILVRFRTFYFVSGTFEHEGERKWFRIIYSPNNRYVSENDIKLIMYDRTNYLSDYVIITHFHKVSYKQYLKF